MFSETKRRRKIFNIDIRNTDKIEDKLKEYASEGLFLEKVGFKNWVFREEEPKSVEYSVEYFKENLKDGSTLSQNKAAYLEYTKERGWDIVCQIGGMDVFINQGNNPLPIQTSLDNKFENTRIYYEKTVVKPSAINLVLFLMLFMMQMSTFLDDKISYLARQENIYLIISFISLLTMYALLLIGHYIWVKKSQKQLIQNNKVKPPSKYFKYIENILITLSILCSVMFFYESGFKSMLIMMILMIIISTGIYTFVTSKLKKSNKYIKANKIISNVFLVILSILQINIIMRIVFITPLNIHEDISSNQLPITIDDLYKDIDKNLEFEQYLNIDESMFLTKSTYEEYNLDNPNNIYYEVVQPKYEFIYDLAKKEYKGLYNLLDLEAINPEEFKAKQAYKVRQLEGYVLIYEQKIVCLNIDKEIILKNIDLIMNRLEL